MQELQSLRDEMRDIRRDVTNLSNQQREVSPHGSLNVTTPRSNGPLNCSRTTEFHQPPHFDEELHPPPYSGRRGSFGGRGMPRHFEEVPRPQARQELELYILRLNLEEDKDASMARFLSGLNREIANQLELYPHTTYEDMCHLANKIESQRKRSGMMRSSFPNQRQVATTKPPTSNFKPWPKKEEAPRGHYASSCPTKRALIFREDLNGWIEKEEDESSECVEGEENGDGDSRTNPFQEGEDDVNRLDMQEHQGVVTRAKARQLKSHKDQIEQEKFQGLNFDVNFDVQDFMGIKF
ncbi:hypothetical protein M9H77_17685 [Catharanthus roseus]|uniref:Uncharacterized protein n=1 Tax=Catharanthus roseus TaxID=4058 RepID=A0ACC0B5A3_CATRO|nr:hypothetical protein M9H77_17685 [Catharanthus roseus]